MFGTAAIASAPARAAETAVLRAAHADDFEAVRTVLARCALPVADLTPQRMDDFIVFEDGGRVIATAGLQRFGRDGLLRSVAVDDDRRGQGLGAALVEAIEQRARRCGLQALWLLTTTAADWFARRDYRAAARDDAPAAMRGSAEFGALCPSSAACLRKPMT
jgi:amino-acid N-acetyltransferase